MAARPRLVERPTEELVPKRPKGERVPSGLLPAENALAGCCIPVRALRLPSRLLDLPADAVRGVPLSLPWVLLPRLTSPALPD